MGTMRPDSGPHHWNVEDIYGQFMADHNGVEKAWRNYAPATTTAAWPIGITAGNHNGPEPVTPADPIANARDADARTRLDAPEALSGNGQNQAPHVNPTRPVPATDVADRGESMADRGRGPPPRLRGKLRQCCADRQLRWSEYDRVTGHHDANSVRATPAELMADNGS